MKPYPAYKDSGVEWLGDVPERWEAGKLGYWARLQGGYAFPSGAFGSEGVAVIKMTNLNRGRLLLDDATHIPESETLERVALQAGDLVWGMSGSVGETGSLGNFARVSMEDLPCQLNQRVGRFVTSAGLISTDFLEFTVQTRIFYEQILLWVTGTAQFNISSEQVETVKIAVPPLPEQRAIAAFLDHETAKIDRLIEKQRRLIALLAEKRQATISHAVTKGLNPNAKLKPSGIDWLGDVPEGWEVRKLKHFAKLQGGYAFSSDLFGSDGVAVVRMTNLDRGNLDLSNVVRIPDQSTSERVTLSEGDLLWGMSGSVGETGSLGNYACVKKQDLPCQLNQRVGRFLVKSGRLSVSFLELIIQTQYFYEQVLLLVTGTAQFNISSEQVESCFVALPSLGEQAAIINDVCVKLSTFDTLTEAATSAITLLQERRAALISAAVTGKIDVRDLVPVDDAHMMEPA